MNDIVLGAILSLASAAVGSGITAFFLYKSARLQVGADRADLELRLESQAKEARRTRLVEARKGYLLPLSEAISKWVESTIQETNMSVRWEESRRKGELDPDNSARALSEAMEKARDLTLQVSYMRGQISDKPLDRLIEHADAMSIKVNAARMPIIRLLNNAEGIDTDTLVKAHEEERRLVELLRDYLLRANKRIEELLSGDESQ